MMADQLFADRYRLENRLGVGGMSTVQLAFDTRLERYVAVKLLAEHLAEDASFVSRFRREALAAARLVHPNVVQVFDFGLDDDDPPQLHRHGARRRPTRARRSSRSTACSTRATRSTSSRRPAAGLDYAHRNGVVHRDVKPGNLLRSHEGVVKLADFGIAKAAEDSEITQAGSVLGTAAYLSPEQARGEKAGPPADLYALGVVSYQLLTGRLPYEAASLTELALHAGVRRRRTSPSDVNPDVPRALGEAVDAGAAPAAEGRYEGALEMGDALRDGLRGIAPEPTDATARARPDRRRRGCSATRRPPRAPRPAPSSRPAAAHAPAARAARRAARAAASRARRASARRQPQPAPRRAKRRNPLRGVFATRAAARGRRGRRARLPGPSRTTTDRAVQLREDVRGGVQDAVDEIKGLIEDNTQ